MLHFVLAALTLEQRRMPLHFCSPEDSDFDIPSSSSPRSIYMSNIYKWTINTEQLTESRERALIVGTNQVFLDKFVQHSYDHAIMQELRELYIKEGSTLGDFYDQLKTTVRGEDFQYLLMPTFVCGTNIPSTKIFERYNVSRLSNAYLSLSYIRAFEEVVYEVFELRDKSHRRYVTPGLYVDKLLKTRFMILTTPFDFSVRQMQESYITCPVTCAGKRLTYATCFTSISVGAESDTRQLTEIQLGDMMAAILGEALIIGSFSDMEGNSTTGEIRQMMAQSAKISNINQLIESSNGQMFELGLGFGFISLTQMMRYSGGMQRIEAGMDAQKFYCLGRNNVTFGEVFTLDADPNIAYKVELVTIVISAIDHNDTVAQFRESSNTSRIDPNAMRSAQFQLYPIRNETQYPSNVIQSYTFGNNFNTVIENDSIVISTRSLFSTILSQQYKITTTLRDAQKYRFSIIFHTETNSLRIQFLSSSAYQQRGKIILSLQSEHLGPHYLYYHCVDNGMDTYGSVMKLNSASFETKIVRTKLRITNQHCRLYYCFNVDEAHFSKVEMLGQYCAFTENYRMDTFSQTYILMVSSYVVVFLMSAAFRWKFQSNENK